MKNYRFIHFVASLVLLVSANSNYSQNIGTIFTSVKAEELYGSVISAVEISKDSLLEILNKTNDYVMLNIVEEKAVFLDQSRNVISGHKISIKESDVFYKCSKSKIIELIDLENSLNLSIEIRSDRLTISNNNYTLEELFPCPPYCE